MPRLSLKKKTFDTVQPVIGSLFIHFPKGITPKVNVIARLEFELA